MKYIVYFTLGVLMPCIWAAWGKLSYERINKGLIRIPDDIPDDTVMVNLMKNRISKISPESLLHLTQLKELILAWNKIDLTSLKPGSFPSSLEVLDLAVNRLRYLPDGVFQNLINLRELDLGANQLTELRPGIWKGLISLQALQLDENKLTEFRGDMLEGLRFPLMLNLNDNFLTEIGPDMWKGLEDTLIGLSLNGNQIVTIQDGAFSKLHKLQSLSLENNRLSTIKREDLPQKQMLKPQLFFLFLSLNPMQCDSKICWIKKASKSQHVVIWGPECVNYGHQAWENVDFACN